MRRVATVCVALACAAVAVVPLSAQEREEHRFTANVGAGFTMPTYGTGSRLDTGWNAVGGVGVNIVPHVGLRAEFMYTEMGVNSSTLSSLQFPGGDTQIWAVTANPVIKFKAHGPFDFYLLGGPGVYHRHVEFTQPTVSTFTAFDPFFGFFPVAVPTQQVLFDFSTTKLGVNGGGGVTFKVGEHAKFYAEARYHQMYTRRITSFLPVTFGFRW